MRRMAICAVSLGLAALLGTMTAPPACACSCAGQSEKEAFAAADAVFVGKVVERGEPIALMRSSADPVAVVFEVGTVYKGSPARRQGISTPAGGASCGLEVGVGHTYVVFAQGDGGRLTASLCGGTRPGDRLAIPAGRAGYAPASAQDDLPSESGAQLLWGGALVLAAAALGGVAIRRRRSGP